MNRQAVTSKTDRSPVNSFKQDVIAGLASTPPRLPCKYLYDQRGSDLFDQICRLDEYYLARAESSIMRRHAASMGRQIGARVMLIEFGSGSSIKTRWLLDQLADPVAYVPVDISSKHLSSVAAELQRDYSEIEILPVAADFTSEFRLPQPDRDFSRKAVYFPGSTIGNFQRHEAVDLLRAISELCGPGGGLLIGIDLDKNPQMLERAYNDPAGITAEFNLNLLHRMRRELGANLDVEGFEHVAEYDENESRIEISLRSLRDQAIEIDDHRFELAEGALIHTEYSHKYSVEGFAKLAACAGFAMRTSWTDENRYFAVLYFAVSNAVTTSDTD